MKTSANIYSLTAASETARYNRDKLKTADKCGCYSCLKIFSPSEITEWGAEEYDGEQVTAICPYCDVDSIIPDNAGFSLTQDFLKAMHKKWFEKETS